MTRMGPAKFCFVLFFASVSTILVATNDFPVPGGPWMTVNFLESAAFTASS